MAEEMGVKFLAHSSRKPQLGIEPVITRQMPYCLPSKPATIPCMTMWQYWLGGKTKPKKAFRLMLNAFKKLLQKFL